LNLLRVQTASKEDGRAGMAERVEAVTGPPLSVQSL
jgi:hypothetical protein